MVPEGWTHSDGKTGSRNINAMKKVNGFCTIQILGGLAIPRFAFKSVKLSGSFKIGL
jgi:hypothetical protein